MSASQEVFYDGQSDVPHEVDPDLQKRVEDLPASGDATPSTDGGDTPA